MINFPPPITAKIATQLTLSNSALALQFPALKHFFRCNELTGAAALLDSIGGLSITASDAATVVKNTDGTLDLTNSATGWDTISSGIVVNPDTKNVLLIWGGKPSAAVAANVRFGIITANTNRGVKSTAQTGTGGSIMADGSVTVTVTNATKLAGTGSQLQTRALACTWHTASVTGVMQEHDFDGTTFNARSTTIASGTASDSLTGMHSTPMDQGILFGVPSNPGFIQMWHFTTMPTANEIRAAMVLAHYYAFTSPFNKIVHPGWAGRN